MAKQTPEFSRIVALDDVRGGPLRRSIEAGPEECAGLAARLGIAALDSLTATVTLEFRKGGRVVIASGRFEAALTQTCVVTLEPLPRTVSETFEDRLAAEPEAGAEAIVEFDLETEDEPEPIDGDSIDIGELVAQHLSLALDPYPRAEGAEVPPDALAAGEAADDGPFAQLARLKPKD